MLAFPCVAMAQIAILQIKVLEGEGAVHRPGARISRPLTVEVTDENGRPVAGAAVTFQLPPEGAGGLFSNGLRTDLVISDAAGRATVHALQLNRIGGPFRIRITAVREQARAGTVSVQYIAENQAAPSYGSATHAPAPPAPAAKSSEITPTTTRMGSGSRRKWILLGVLGGVGGGAAFLGVSRGSNSKTSQSSAVSIGTPSITVGHP